MNDITLTLVFGIFSVFLAFSAIFLAYLQLRRMRFGFTGTVRHVYELA